MTTKTDSPSPTYYLPTYRQWLKQPKICYKEEAKFISLLANATYATDRMTFLVRKSSSKIGKLSLSLK